MSISRAVLLISLLLPALCTAADTPWKQSYHLAPAIEEDLGFARAVRAGDTLYIAGSVGAGEMSVAIKQAYDRIAKTLEAHHLGFEHIVKETLYTTDLESFRKIRELRKQYYKGDYPASTWVEVRRLSTPDLVLEVEAIAIIPQNAKLAQ
jgi:2-iminobutanoate/2-iminopropanoate deaminase